MSRGNAPLTFRRWLLVCVLVVWPLNFYYLSKQTSPGGSESFWVHGAPMGAIVAFVLGVAGVRRARRHRAMAMNSGAARVGFWGVARGRWWWCLLLLPLLARFHWTTSSWTRINGAPQYGETVTWGWGGPGSALFALAVVFASLAIAWRKECEAAAVEHAG